MEGKSRFFRAGGGWMMATKKGCFDGVSEMDGPFGNLKTKMVEDRGQRGLGR